MNNFAVPNPTINNKNNKRKHRKIMNSMAQLAANSKNLKLFRKLIVNINKE